MLDAAFDEGDALYFNQTAIVQVSRRHNGSRRFVIAEKLCIDFIDFPPQVPVRYIDPHLQHLLS